jgi:hypothetical protein
MDMHVGFRAMWQLCTLIEGGVMRIRRFLCLPALLFAALATNLAAANYSCPVTTRPDPPFVPPAPYEPNAVAGRFWYGTNDLWVERPASGVDNALPYSKEEGYSDKLFLWKQGNDGTKEHRPDIIVVVKRLDVAAPLTSSRGGNNIFVDGTWMMATGVTYPTAGCWEVTAANNGHMLTFVVSIQP